MKTIQIATAKHYILNEQEHYRSSSSSNIDDRTMHEIYGLPFMYSVLAGVGSVMCSYNLVLFLQLFHFWIGLLKTIIVGQ
jgi:beta-glucosidase-like glycosyl hydrolase